MSGYVYLTIEMKQRELESKCLLAIKLIEKGYSVVIGQQWAIFKELHKLPKGIVFFKSYHKIYDSSIKLAKKCGHKVIVHDEELFLQFPEQTFSESIDAGIREYIDAILVNSKSEREILISKGFDNLINFGNPRLELLQQVGKKIYSSKITEIKKKHGNYVLINTNFGTINSSWGDIEKVRAAQEQAGYIKKGSNKIFDATIRAEKYADKVITEIVTSTKVNINFIIRPHPSENIEYWRYKFSNFPNVSVIREGHHAPWTMAASCLIHSNCATGLEALVMGVPVISIEEQGGNELFDQMLVNKVTRKFNYAEQIQNIIEAGSIENINNEFNLDQLIYNSGNDIRSYDVFINVVDNMMKSSKKSKFDDIVWGANVPQLKTKCDISFDEIQDVLNLINIECDIRSNYKLKELTNSLFLIELDNNLEKSYDDDVYVGNISYSNTSSYLEYVDKLVAKREYEKALNSLKEKLEWESNNYYYNMKTAEIYFSLVMEEKAATYFIKALMIDGNKFEAELGYGKCVYKKNPSIMIDAFEKAISINSDNSKKLVQIFSNYFEYYAFAKRIQNGQMPYHVNHEDEMGFENMQNIISKILTKFKNHWNIKENRNHSLYESIALASFAKKGIDSSLQFLNIIREKNTNSIWNSVWLNSEKPEFYMTSDVEPVENSIRIISSKKINNNKKSEFGILLSCDILYYKNFAIPMLNSLKETGYKGRVFIHIMTTDNFEDLKITEINDLDIEYHIEDVSSILDSMKRRVYYHISRFNVLKKLVNEYSIPICMMDVDSLFNNSPEEIFNNHKAADVAMRGRPCRLHIWNQYNASVFLVNPTENGKNYINHICHYLNSLWVNNLAKWGADQVAMFLVHKYIINSSHLKISWLNNYEVDYDYDDKGIVWQNSGVSKFANDMKKLNSEDHSSRYKYNSKLLKFK